MINEVKAKSGNKEVKPSKRGNLDTGKKARVPVHTSIGDALSKHSYGHYFTTPASDRIYVITHGTWGEKSKDKVVKGFPGGTDINVIKAYSKRTNVKHGPAKMPTTSQGKAKAGYATKKYKDLEKRKKALD
jgi:hypothetical protein|tara:strand:- start:183 stop:575 length:393 start_codon:yes stop_codon:yes gene_type:complete